jgi:hypothetical protein
MKRAVGIFLSLLLLVSIAFPYYTIVVGYASLDEKEFVIKSSVKFTALGQAWNFTEEEKAISLYMNNSWQTVYLVNSSQQIETVKADEDGNAIAILNLSQAKVGTSAEYNVFYQVVSKPRTLPNIDENTALSLSDIPHNLTEPYLSNSGTWMTNNSKLKTQAELLAGSETNVLAIVENFVSWMWGQIKYPNSTNPAVSHEVPLYPNETLSYKEGDCDDQAILLISLCRIIGIPAYLQIGCIYMPSQNDATPSPAWNETIENIQIHIAWHGWAMVYIPPWGWLPVDLTYSSRGSPLDAIKTAAVTSQGTMQYMNIIETDYVNEARQYRSFLINNNFCIQAYDEIILGRGTDAFGFISDSSMQYVLITYVRAMTPLYVFPRLPRKDGKLQGVV